jgi:hypothetical protein
MDVLSETLAESLSGGDPEMEALLIEELMEGKHVVEALAAGRQKRIAAANARIERAFSECLGEQTMSVDLESYLFWAQREPGCWGDAAFKREFARDNPEVRVRCRSRKTMIGYRKNYGVLK